MHPSSFLPRILAKLVQYADSRPPIKRSSQTCRLRKVKCDGSFPICRTCQRSGRICEREIPNHSSNHRSSTQDTTEKGYNNSQRQNLQLLDLPTPEYPRSSLKNRRVCSIFQHYIKNLASWYDLNDRLRRFEDVVPRHALDDSLLFSAVIAFSAIHLSRLNHQTEFQYIAEFYHLESIRRLIAVTNNGERIHNGATLAATCLLRSYEILAENVGTQSHLHGSSSLLAGQQIQIGADLISAGFWNYLREDITVALMEKRRLKIDLSNVSMPNPIEDNDRANVISQLLGIVINRCLGRDAPALALSEWTSLQAKVDRWKADLPRTFEPVSLSIPRKTKFAELVMFHGWHIAAMQYYYTAESILTLAAPTSAGQNAWQKAEHINNMRRKLESNAIQLCSLAISNESNAARVNAFGPICFCGPWITDAEQRIELVGALRLWQDITAWPVDMIIHILSTAWQTE
ncbi:transcriptional regulator family: Fungal Specific TF [Paecilomyces variotii]|nr:transcriptional regulator family: Fungal Specific TF [Paecilomyces variotii]